MAGIIPPAVSVDDVTLQDVDGVLSVKDGGIDAAKWGAGVIGQKFEMGSSSSGTPGTVYATIEATAGYYFPQFWGFISQVGGSSGTTVRLTFIDDTTEDLNNTTALSNDRPAVTRAGVATVPWVDVAKKVKKVELMTFNTGTGARNGGLTGAEVPL